MSVVEQLGVADMERGLAEARELWQDWVAQDRRLALAPAVDGLPDWLLSVNYDRADDVLHALVRIGSPSGGDCQAAVWALGLSFVYAAQTWRQLAVIFGEQYARALFGLTNVLVVFGGSKDHSSTATSRT